MEGTPSNQPNNQTPAPADRGQIWLKRATILWIVLAVAVGVKVIVQRDSHSVYPIFRDATRHWWADEPIYTGEYFYSPTFAVALTPFAILPDRLGGVLWGLASVAVLFWALRVLVRELLPGSWPPWREGLFLGLTLVNSVRGVWSGQSNALLLAVVIFAAVAINRRRWSTASILLAVSVLIKIWPVALVMLLAARWPRQLIWRFSAAVTGLAAVPLLTRPFQVACRQYHDWYENLFHRQAIRFPGQRDAWTIWETIHPPVPDKLYLALQLLTAVAVLGWCLYQWRRTLSTRRLLVLILAIWVAWQLLWGTGSERLTYLIIAPMTTWTLLESLAERKLRVLSAVAWLMTGLLGTGGVERALLPYLPAAPAILPLGTIVFVAWLIVHERGPAPQDSPAAGCSQPATAG